MEITKNQYEKFEFSLFNELFLILRNLCNTHIQSYHTHLLWHGIDICAEIFNRKFDASNTFAFRQSRQVLLSWISFIIDKVNLNNYDFVSGLCDLRCYNISQINVDKNIFDRNSIGPQIPPPNRLRLQEKQSLKLQLTTNLLKPSPIIPYEKMTKKKITNGKLTDQDVILEERWKSFDEFKEIKYIKIFLELLINNQKFFQYKKALEISKNVLQHRYEFNIPFRQIDSYILTMLIETTKYVTRYLTSTFVEKNNMSNIVNFKELSKSFLSKENVPTVPSTSSS